MTGIRIPQTRGEVEAAVEFILYAAHIEPFSLPERDRLKRIERDRVILKEWLNSMSRFGALPRPDLAMRAIVAIEKGSDELIVFGGYRIVGVINRRQWVGGGRMRIQKAS